MTDKHTLDLARQWAADIDADRQTLSQDTIDAAADLISSLPDEWVSVDALRKYISDWREGLAKAPRDDYEDEILDDLEDMLPTPPAPRTMADIEWDDAEHHLAEARAAEDGLDGNISDTVIMLGVNRFGNVSALDTSTWGAWALSRDTLTPTGRKYRLIPDEGVPEGDPIETDDDHASHCASCAEMDDDEPEFDPAYLYRDKDGEHWAYLNHNWRCINYGHDATNYLTPPAKYRPYTRIEDTK